MVRLPTPVRRHGQIDHHFESLLAVAPLQPAARRRDDLGGNGDAQTVAGTTLVQTTTALSEMGNKFIRHAWAVVPDRDPHAVIVTSDLA